MPSGKVILVGTLVGDTGGYNGQYPATNLLDRDFSTFWASQSQGGNYVGFDMGAGNSAVPVEYQITPRTGDVTFDYEVNSLGSTIQASNDPSFATGVVTLATTVAFPFTPSRGVNRFPLSGSTAYRAFRLLEPNSSYGQIAEFCFVVSSPTTGAGTRPVAPRPSPWGGRFPGKSSITVNIASDTTSATIYYTLDGSTPTTASSSTSGVITVPLTTNAITTLKVLGYDSSCSSSSSTITTAYFAGYAYKPDDDWYDDNGTLIEAHSGGILDDTARSGRYYWYGQSFNKFTAGQDLRSNTGVWCYSSTDLLNWRFEGNILDNTSANWLYVIRPHVIYNSTTNKYVLWAHAENTHDTTDRAVVASSSSPGSGWAWVSTSLNPDGQGFKDCSLFQDDDGSAYIVYTIGTQNGIIISKLSADYLSTSGTYQSITATNRESPVIVKRSGVYFLITSLSNFYDSTQTFNVRYMSNTVLLSTWGDPSTSGSTLYSSDPVGSNYNSQPAFVFKLPGKIDGFFLGSDFFTSSSLYNSRQVWLPLSFPTKTTMAISTPAVWDASTFVSLVIGQSQTSVFVAAGLI